MIQEGGPAAGPESSEPEQIRAEIEETRGELGETVEALAEKADVKSQAKARVDERKQALKQRQQELKGMLSDIPARARQVKPEDAKRVASRAADSARERPGPTLAAALAVGLLLRSVIRRRRS